MVVVFIMMACLGTLFAIIDMGMNGKYADAAPYWFGCAAIGLAGSWWMGAL